MANTRSGNTYYVDATGALVTNNGIRLRGIVLTPSAANGSITLKDTTTSANKGTYEVDTAHRTNYIYFWDNPIVFPNGITVSALSNMTAVLILEEGRT